jgi:methionyl-tRNA formyltransferase
VCGVLTQPDRPRGRGQRVTPAPVKALAAARGVPLVQPERLRDPEVADTLARWSPDLGVVAAYGKLIPESLLAIPGLGMINVHASLLPRYRGAAPVHRAVIAGDSDTGVTIMRVVRELDAGAMLARAVRGIGPDETSEEVERDLARMGAALLAGVVDALARGPLKEAPQDGDAATYAPRLRKEEGLVDWELPATAIHNLVRGLQPWPHAYTYLHGRRLILLSSRVERQAAPSASGTAGTILAAEGGAFHVATGAQGRLAIERLQPEGGRPMGAREFLAGHAVAPGSQLGSP